MHLFYTMTVDDSHVEQPRLVARITLTSHEIYSPYMDVDDLDAGELETRDDGIDLGIVTYPRADASAQLLPPLLLLDPIDDPETAEERYTQYGGYRFVAQFILPNTSLGETVDVHLGRKALAVWRSWQDQSESHQRAAREHERELEDLFRVEESDFLPGQVEPLPDSLHGVICKVRAALSRSDCGGCRDALRQLEQVDGQHLPLASIFPCLHSASEDIRQLALSLLSRAHDRLSVDVLDRVIDRAEMPARLAAISLLGKIGGAQSLSTLLCMCNRRFSSIRMAGLRALFETCYSSDLGQVGYLDVLTTLRRLSRTDEAAVVREVAAELVELVGGPAMLDRLINEREARW